MSEENERANVNLKQTLKEISDRVRSHWLVSLVSLLCFVVGVTWQVIDNVQVKPLKSEIAKMQREKESVKPINVYVYNQLNQQIKLPELTILSKNADSPKKQPDQDEVAKLFLQAVSESSKSGNPITINDIPAHVDNVKVNETADHKIIVTADSATPVSAVITEFSSINFGQGWKFTPSGVAPIQPTEPKK